MTKRIIYTMDDPNYSGGAHTMTLSQIDFLSRSLAYRVAVLCLTDPADSLCSQYPSVQFIGPKALYEGPFPQNDDTIIADLLAHVEPEDIVCVPFENSRFRQAVAELCCRWKVQWIHIDYARWSELNSWTRSVTAQDGSLYEKFDRIVFISQMSRDGFAAKYPHLQDKCRVCHNLMDEARIHLLAAEEPETDFYSGSCLKLVTVARLEEQQKGIGRCLLAAQQLRQQGLAFEWVFVGGGHPQDMPLYRDFVKKNGLEKNIFFSGPQQNPFAYMRKADVFCLFSRYEGIPNTIFESMIAGTPVAATRAGATPEQIPPGSGWLCENDTASMVQLLKTLIDRPSLVQKARQSLAGYRYDNTAIQKTIAAIFDPAQEEAESMEPAVSVIVPIYNVQDYLDQCLASLEGQTLKNIEVILVNDGSTDHSGEVMDRYVQRNPGRFFRYDKENGGLGSARNYGIDRARGRYIAFIDSDDFVEPDMMEKLYAVAQSHSCDIVQSDLHGFNNNVDYQAVERTPFGEEGIVPQKTLMLYATKPVVVSACTKLYRKSLFDKFRFPDTWYEDMGLIPILFSFTNRVYYLPQPLYHYRWERAGSIQTQKDSPRTLEILQSKQRILDLCNPQWLPQAEYAVYEHTCRFYRGKPHFATQTMDFVLKHATRFRRNPYIQKAIACGELADLLPREEALPATLHCLRFGGTPLSASAQKCRESWQQFLPQYRIREWTEQDFDMGGNAYLQRAWMHRDYAAAAGYLACKILLQEGGLYLDPGMLLKAPLNGTDGYDLFLPRAGEEQASWEIMGAATGHPLLRDILDLYAEAEYQPEDPGSVRHGIWQILVQKYGLSPENASTQILNGHIALFPAERLLIDVGTGGNMAEHVCDGFSQSDAADAVRHQLQKQYYLDRYLPKPAPDETPADIFTGTSYQIADAVVQRYGIAFILRAVCKRVLAVLLPGIYRRLDPSAAEKQNP